MFFLFILIILFILGVAIYTSKIEIEIENLEIDTEKPKGEKINEDGKIYLYVIIFWKIKVIKNNLRKFDKQKLKFQNKDLDFKFLKDKDIKIDYKDLLQKIDVDFKKLDLNVKIGTENAALTAILIGIISSAIGIIIKKPKFEIIPIFVNKNFLKIKLDCIFSINLMQYIYKIISSKKNKKVEV